MSDDKQTAVEALAEARASIDGKASRFEEERNGIVAVDELTGTYEGYMGEAREMIRRLSKRGYVLAPSDAEPVGWFVRMETGKKVIWHSQDSQEEAQRYAKAHSTYGGKAMQLYTHPDSSSEAVREALKIAWSNFCDENPDDLNSPEELPDHALMTCEQFVSYALSALNTLNVEGQQS